jgi:hypothetical protein
MEDQFTMGFSILQIACTTLIGLESVDTHHRLGEVFAVDRSKASVRLSYHAIALTDLQRFIKNLEWPQHER